MIEFAGDVARWFTDSQHWSGSDGIMLRTVEHIWLAVLSTAIAAAIALPPAVILAHRRIGAFTANALVNVGRAVPSFGIIVVALKRNDHSSFNPEADERIEAGDVLVALGPIQALDQIERASQ